MKSPPISLPFLLRIGLDLYMFNLLIVSADRCPPFAFSRPLPTLDDAPVLGKALVLDLLLGLGMIDSVRCYNNYGVLCKILLSNNILYIQQIFLFYFTLTY